MKSSGWTVAFRGGPWRKDGGILGDVIMGMDSEGFSFNSGIECGWGRLI